MKRKVYLHIGTEKTGTASIQHFLSRHYDELREKGILYPKSLGRKSNMKLSAALQNYIKRDDLRITYAKNLYEQKISEGLSNKEAMREVSIELNHHRQEITQYYLARA